MSHFEIVTEVDYSLVVQRLLGETEFWGREALIKLVENGLFPSRYVCVHASKTHISHSKCVTNVSFVGECLEAALHKRDWVCVLPLLRYCTFGIIESFSLGHC